MEPRFERRPILMASSGGVAYLRVRPLWAVSVVLVRGRPTEAVAMVGFTGTVAQSLVVSLLGGELHDARPKSFSVTPFFVNGRPAVDKAVAGPGDILELRAAFAQRELAERFIAEVAKGYTLFGRRVVVEELEFYDVFSQPLPEAQCFKLEFLTPLRFAVKPLYRRSRAVFDFLPRPLSVFKSAVRHGRALGLLKLGAPFLRWVHTYVALTDFGCRGRCVVTVKLPNGGVARGFVGWALYRSFGKRRIADLWRALRVAEAFNLGTGRGMGLGVVRVTPLDCPGNGPAAQRGDA
ncbi:CRISPR-associated protein, Cas6 family [Pyrobaculum arsenaticum DSM 13514]|uniref:CRISPR-associated protein, Cas6 family n=1 Tax=Pyrobaculum arsenaticum (strain DSM 13514 / JCM 11321 / PZ6) TaxID=340102 RepID=A4WJZ4_PYRAR|nr:CRISPR-associated protein, Cas6 family [Pyrobaculum arsenaticum DSM 13514]